MVTEIGGRLIYDNIGMGAAKHPEDKDSIFLTFTDKDNEKIHMIPVAISRLEQYFSLVRQTVAGQSIEIAGPGDMPRGPQ